MTGAFEITSNTSLTPQERIRLLDEWSAAHPEEADGIAYKVILLQALGRWDELRDSLHLLSTKVRPLDVTLLDAVCGIALDASMFEECIAVQKAALPEQELASISNAGVSAYGVARKVSAAYSSLGRRKPKGLLRITMFVERMSSRKAP